MKWIARSVLLLAFIAIASQDITGRKGCDCSICKGVDNKINPIVGKRIGDDGGGKSSCNICERRKELLRMEREKQRKLQKCPFEILGSTSTKGKTSEEIFDEFREQIVPSQNGFFDMMRGIVKTMHVSSVAELKWAKEKEARELAKKKKEEAEEAKRRKESKPPKDELVGLNSPVNPKVTVVLKQTPCGQVVQPSQQAMPEKISLMKRLPKESDSDRIPEEEVSPLQLIDLTDGHDTLGDYGDLISKGNLLRSDIIDQLMGFKATTTEDEEITTAAEPEEDLSFVGVQSDSSENLWETSGSPFVKFLRNEEINSIPSEATTEPEDDLPTIGEHSETESSFVKFLRNDQIKIVSSESTDEPADDSFTVGEHSDSFESSTEPPFVLFLRNDQTKISSSTTETEAEPVDNLSAVEEHSDSLESTTESPFVKFLTNEEMKALSGGKNSLDDFDMGLNMLPTSMGMDEENAESINY